MSNDMKLPGENILAVLNSIEKLIEDMKKKNQMSEEKKMSLCNFIVTNNEQQPLLPQVIALHKQLLHLVENNVDE